MDGWVHMYELWMPLGGKQGRGKEVYTVKMSASGIFIFFFLLRWAGLVGHAVSSRWAACEKSRVPRGIVFVLSPSATRLTLW